MSPQRRPVGRRRWYQHRDRLSLHFWLSVPPPPLPSHRTPMQEFSSYRSPNRNWACLVCLLPYNLNHVWSNGVTDTAFVCWKSLANAAVMEHLFRRHHRLSRIIQARKLRNIAARDNDDNAFLQSSILSRSVLKFDLFLPISCAKTCPLVCLFY